MCKQSQYLKIKFSESEINTEHVHVSVYVWVVEVSTVGDLTKPFNHQTNGAFSRNMRTPNISQSWFSTQSSWHESRTLSTAPPLHATSAGSISCDETQEETMK